MNLRALDSEVAEFVNQVVQVRKRHDLLGHNPDLKSLDWKTSYGDTLRRSDVRRPHDKSVLKGKPVLTFTASPAFTGGVRAQQQFNETLWAIPVELVRYLQIVIGGVGAKIAQGRLVDDAVRQFMEKELLALRTMIFRT